MHSDFVLENFNNTREDVYIEHWGYNLNNRDYTKTRKYKIPIYKDHKITFICTNEKDMTDPKTSLSRKLKYYKKGEINYDDDK